MSPPEISKTKSNLQNEIKANINRGTKRSRIYQDNPEYIWDTDSNEILEEEISGRERNAKRPRNTSGQNVTHHENVYPSIETPLQIQSKKQLQLQSQSSTPQQEEATGFDLAFSKNPAGSGIEFGAVCQECGIVCVTGKSWSIHQDAHRGKGIECDFCPQVFLTLHASDAHEQLHRGGQCRDVDDYCECGICGGSFVAVMYLELHLLELHGWDSLQDPRSLRIGPSIAQDPSPKSKEVSTQQLFRCGICNAVFSYILNLDCHMALHSEVSYACALCDIAYCDMDSLVSHSQIHQNTNSAHPKRLPPQQQMEHSVYPNFPMWGALDSYNPTATPATMAYSYNDWKYGNESYHC